MHGEQEKVEQLLHQTFRPEFLNRIDEIVYFHPLDKDVQLQVVSKMLDDLVRRLNEIYYSFSFTAQAKKKILDDAYSPEFGARPLKRYIQNEVETLLAKKIMANEVDTKHAYVVDVKDDQFVVLTK